jgi:hypothetical protein
VDGALAILYAVGALGVPGVICAWLIARPEPGAGTLE